MPKGKPISPPWVDTPTLLKSLSISRSTLIRYRRNGVFRLGKHYRIISLPKSKNPTYRYHLDLCAAELGKPLEQR
jgi:hypothetical protein